MRYLVNKLNQYNSHRQLHRLCSLGQNGGLTNQTPRLIYNHVWFCLYFLPFIFFSSTVGAPIPVAKNALPTRGEVEALHGVYVEALKTLFDENKTKYGIKEDTKLEII